MIAQIIQVIYSQIVVNQCKIRGTGDMSKQGTFGRSSELNTCTLETVPLIISSQIKPWTYDIFKNNSQKNKKKISPHNLSYKLWSRELRKKTLVIDKGRCYICRSFSGNCSITWTSNIKHKISFCFSLETGLLNLSLTWFE